MSSASSVAPLEQPPLSQGERVVDTFIAPSKTFTDIRRSASWWVPWILLAIFSLAMVTVVDKKLGMDKVVENQMALSPKQAEKLDQLPPDQRASQMQTIVKFNRTIAYAYPVIAIIIVAIMAAVLMGTFNLGFGAHLTFNQCMAISMYASLPGIIKALIAILAISVGGGESFTFQNPVASNLGALVDPSSHFLYSVATSLDVFTIWVIVLTGLGYACVTKLKRGTCMAVVFGWWAVVVLAGAGFAALFA
jgi:Yip1 domain